MFSIICVAILTGSVVERMRFTPLTIFVVFWLFLVYYPFAHMVWDEGLLAKWGTIDFAGGDVVHITSGVSALVLGSGSPLVWLVWFQCRLSLGC